MSIGELAATVVINGVSQAGHIEKIDRHAQFCRAGQDITIELDSGADHPAMLPGQTLVVTEQGTLTLTGYVEKVEAIRAPASVVVHGKDKFKLAIDYFIDTQLTINGETAAYWVGYLCDLCGLSYSLSAIGPNLGTDVPIGIRSVADALKYVAAVARWQMRMTPSGVLQFISLPANPTYADADLSSYISGEYSVSDETTRNVAKVWGYDPATGSYLNKIYTRTVPGISQQRIMVYADPNINTTLTANLVGNALLDQYGSLDKQFQLEIIGQPSLQVGDAAFASVRGNGYIRYVSDLSTRLDESGYGQSVHLGRRCFSGYWGDSSGSSTGSSIGGDSGGGRYFQGTYCYVMTPYQFMYSPNVLSDSPVWFSLYDLPVGPGPFPRFWDFNLDTNPDPPQLFGCNMIMQDLDGFPIGSYPGGVRQGGLYRTQPIISPDYNPGFLDWQLAYSLNQANADIPTAAMMFSRMARIVPANYPPSYPTRWYLLLKGADGPPTLSTGEKFVGKSDTKGFGFTFFNIAFSPISPPTHEQGNASGIGFAARRKFTNGVLDGDIVYFAGSTVVANTTDLYRSTNAGAVFNLVGQIGSGNVSGSVYIPHGNNNNSEILFVTNRTKVFKSIDAGATWADITPSGYSGQASAYDLVTQWNNSDVVYCLDAAGKLFKSTNGGTSWTNIHTFQTASGAIYFHPIGILYYMSGSLITSNLIATLGPIQVSVDGGNTWLNKSGNWPGNFDGRHLDAIQSAFDGGINITAL